MIVGTLQLTEKHAALWSTAPFERCLASQGYIIRIVLLITADGDLISWDLPIPETRRGVLHGHVRTVLSRPVRHPEVVPLSTTYPPNRITSIRIIAVVITGKVDGNKLKESR